MDSLREGLMFVSWGALFMQATVDFFAVERGGILEGPLEGLEEEGLPKVF